MISAPMTPGTHAQSVRRKTIRNDPQPLSTTARGGKRIQRSTRQRDIGITNYELRITSYEFYFL